MAVAVTSGGAVTAAPLPANLNQLRFISESCEPAVGAWNTRNRRCVPAGIVSGRSAVTSRHVCQPPVGVISGEVKNAGLAGSSKCIEMVPPAPPEETRNVTLSRSSRL